MEALRRRKSGVGSKHATRVIALAMACACLVTPFGARAQGNQDNEAVSAAEAGAHSWAFGDLWGDTEERSLMDPGDWLGEYEYRATTSDTLLRHERSRVQIVVRRSMKERGYQFLTVSVDGSEVYSAPVSTAWERLAPGKTGNYRAFTPDGKFLPDGMQTRRFSNRWQVWLSHVIRFNGGIWLHATTPDHFLELGAPASGGCVRLHPRDAAKVYELVERYGIRDTAITVLPADRDEPQVPWKLQKGRALPPELASWRQELLVK